MLVLMLMLMHAHVWHTAEYAWPGLKLMVVFMLMLMHSMFSSQRSILGQVDDDADAHTQVQHTAEYARPGG